MNQTKYFNDIKMPFIEARFSTSNNHYKKHIHESFSIGAIIQGKSTYTNKDKEFQISDGILVFVNPNEIHSCNSLNKQKNSYYMLYLDKKWCYGIQKEIFDDIEQFLPFNKPLIEDKKLFEEFKELNQLLFSNEFYIKKECALINFVSKIYLENFNSLKKESNKNQKIEEIINYLQLHVKENISVEELSKEFSLSTYYITKLFTKELNISLYSYFLNLKINLAKKLLKQNYSIVDTALECGFFDQSHFHRNFLKIVAITPKKYKDNFVQ